MTGRVTQRIRAYGKHYFTPKAFITLLGTMTGHCHICLVASIYFVKQLCSVVALREEFYSFSKMFFLASIWDITKLLFSHFSYRVNNVKTDFFLLNYPCMPWTNQSSSERTSLSLFKPVWPHGLYPTRLCFVVWSANISNVILRPCLWVRLTIRCPFNAVL